MCTRPKPSQHLMHVHTPKTVTASYACAHAHNCHSILCICTRPQLSQHLMHLHTPTTVTASYACAHISSFSVRFNCPCRLNMTSYWTFRHDVHNIILKIKYVGGTYVHNIRHYTHSCAYTPYKPQHHIHHIHHISRSQSLIT